MKRVFTVLGLLIVVLLAGVGWYVYSKQPTRQGQVELRNLQGSVTVRYDERGVPHIRAEHEADLHVLISLREDSLAQLESEPPEFRQRVADFVDDLVSHSSYFDSLFSA